VLAWLTVLLAVSASLLLATALRLATLVSTLLAAYLVLEADAVVVTIGLSPLRAVTPRARRLRGAAVRGALAAWWLRTTGWRIRPLGSYWLVATAPHPSRTGCL
jgi:hypothetical protein